MKNIKKIIILALLFITFFSYSQDKLKKYFKNKKNKDISIRVFTLMYDEEMYNLLNENIDENSNFLLKKINIEEILNKLSLQTDAFVTNTTEFIDYQNSNKPIFEKSSSGKYNYYNYIYKSADFDKKNQSDYNNLGIHLSLSKTRIKLQLNLYLNKYSKSLVQVTIYNIRIDSNEEINWEKINELVKPDADEDYKYYE